MRPFVQAIDGYFYCVDCGHMSGNHTKWIDETVWHCNVTECNCNAEDMP